MLSQRRQWLPINWYTYQQENKKNGLAEAKPFCENLIFDAFQLYF